MMVASSANKSTNICWLCALSFYIRSTILLPFLAAYPLHTHETDCAVRALTNIDSDQSKAIYQCLVHEHHDIFNPSAFIIIKRYAPSNMRIQQTCI